MVTRQDKTRLETAIIKKIKLYRYKIDKRDKEEGFQI